MLCTTYYFSIFAGVKFKKQKEERKKSGAVTKKCVFSVMNVMHESFCVLGKVGEPIYSPGHSGPQTASPVSLPPLRNNFNPLTVVMRSYSFAYFWLTVKCQFSMLVKGKKLLNACHLVGQFFYFV